MKAQQNNKSFSRKLIEVAAASATAIAMLAIAMNSGKAVASTVYFMATENKVAILKPVTWNVVGGVLATPITETRHTWQMAFAPGNYTARVLCNGRNLSRGFSVLEDDSSNVTVACD